MRDIIITLAVVALLPFIFRNPLFGVYGFAWLSMMSPHKGGWGFARDMPFAQIVAIVTLICLLFSRHRKAPPLNSITVTILLIVLWMTITSFFAIADSADVLERWIFVIKVQIMLFATLMLVRGRQQIDWLIWVIVVSIGFYGVKGGIWTLATGGGGRVWGPSGLLEGNNELAVALVMILPLMYYLFQVASAKAVRVGLMFAMLTTSFAVLGSQSRGALLALVSMAIFLAIKGKRPVLMSVVIATLLVGVVAFMPDTWTQRMDTIQSYQSDGSAMSRVYTWKTLFNCAMDRPITGAGFRADNLTVFAKYAPRDAEFDVFIGAVWVAHSIYFQMLGEQGFPGLILFLLLGVFSWLKASKLARECKNHPEFGAWVPNLMPMIQVSLIGYSVGGAFLSLAYLDVIYYIVAIIAMVDATWNDHLKESLIKKSPTAEPRPQGS